MGSALLVLHRWAHARASERGTSNSSVPAPFLFKRFLWPRETQYNQSYENHRVPISSLTYKKGCKLLACSLLNQRKDRDSNPGYPKGYNGFRDRPVRPLRHLSNPDTGVIFQLTKVQKIFSIQMFCMLFFFRPCIIVPPRQFFWLLK